MRRPAPGAALRLLLVCLLVCLCAALAACAGDAVTDTAGGQDGGGTEAAADPQAAESGEAVSEPEPQVKKKRRERAVSVPVAEAVRRDLVVPVHAEGSIRARHAADILVERSGRVRAVHVREGQRVRRGQLLISLDDRELVLAREEAKARLLRALAQLAVEEQGFEGPEGAERVFAERSEELRRLEDAGEISRRERLDRELVIGMEAVRAGAYRSELMEVRSGLAAARADAERLRIELERTEIRAPFAGVVSGLELDPGEHVMAGQKVFRLVDDVRLEAVVSLLESDLARVSVGREARLSLPALEEELPVTVDIIDPEVDPESRTCRLLMRVEHGSGQVQPGQVKPGMFVRAAIAGSVYQDRLLVPRQAIVTRDGRPVVFRVEDDRAQWVYVELGEQNDRWVEIASVYQGGPLEAGTPVILENHLTLSHQAKVKIKKVVEIDDPWAADSDASTGAGDS